MMGAVVPDGVGACAAAIISDFAAPFNGRRTPGRRRLIKIKVGRRRIGF
jgi:hypothetical protein